MLKKNMSALEFIGAGSGIFGALVIASNTAYSPYGWIAFLISSVSLAFFAVHCRTWGLLSLQVCFCATNLIGLWQWLISPSLGQG